MKFPYSMLLDYVRTGLNAEQAGDLLTMAGFELEGIEEVDGEAVLDIKVMSNRGDGLSVLGLAREVLAKDPSAEPTGLYLSSGVPPVQNEVPVSIETEACTRYAGRLFTQVRNGPSPKWIQDRLVKAGMRPISLLVDVTNYVMLERGQPMHAFDFDKVRGSRIVVRSAKPGEKITTLDGQERELSPFMMMICDAERPIGIAGVMGGQETEVSDRTTTVLLESAHFQNTSVRKTRRALGLSTEASYRYERSVDPNGVLAAIQRFTELIGDAAQPGATTDLYPAPPARTAIRLRVSRAARLLGMPIAETDARQHLSRLGFEVQGEGEELSVTPPSWRPDISREEDLVEEIGRVHGYDRIPEALPHGSTTLGGPKSFEAWKDVVREATVRLGFQQTISHSLRDESPLDDGRFQRIGPRGISDPDMKWLRNSTLPSLADAARRNGGRDLQLFEIGQVFGKKDGQYVEYSSLGLLSQGAIQPEWWSGKAVALASFFTLKGALEELGRTASVDFVFRPPASLDPRLHPTRQAEILAGDQAVGLLGQIDPDTAEAAGLPAETVLAEVNVTAAYGFSKTGIQVREISRNPAIRRDLAFLIDKSIPFQNVSDRISSAAGDLMERQWLFDVYEGKGVPEGKHSLAVALQLRKVGGNLTDEEANQVRERVVAALAELGATPR